MMNPTRVTVVLLKLVLEKCVTLPQFRSYSPLFCAVGETDFLSVCFSTEVYRKGSRCFNTVVDVQTVVTSSQKQRST